MRSVNKTLTLVYGATSYLIFSVGIGHMCGEMTR